LESSLSLIELVLLFLRRLEGAFSFLDFFLIDVALVAFGSTLELVLFFFFSLSSFLDSSFLISYFIDSFFFSSLIDSFLEIIGVESSIF